MKEEKGKLVSINHKKYKKYKKELWKATSEGELRAFAKHPITGIPIRVHPDLIKRMQEGETFTIEEIINKKFD